MDSVFKQMEKDAENLIFEQPLTKEEILMFEQLADKESIHNEMGALLGQYRDSIVETRNQFVAHLTSKYRVPDPRHTAYDPITQKLVSVFHPNLKAHKIVSRPHAFSQLASDLVLDAIKKLGDCLKLSKKS
jgi:hypothetical protein